MLQILICVRNHITASDLAISGEGVRMQIVNELSFNI